MIGPDVCFRAAGSPVCATDQLMRRIVYGYNRLHRHSCLMMLIIGKVGIHVGRRNTSIRTEGGFHTISDVTRNLCDRLDSRVVVYVMLYEGTTQRKHGDRCWVNSIPIQLILNLSILRRDEMKRWGAAWEAISPQVGDEVWMVRMGEQRRSLTLHS